jgi:hypothetical protein
MAFLHASKSGYFPFCLEEVTEGQYGPGTGNPFEMSLEDAMTLYWKYRSVKITGSISGNFTATVGPDFKTWLWTVAGSGSLVDGGQIKMSDLVCNNFSTLTLLAEAFNQEPQPSDPVVISNIDLGSVGIFFEVAAGGSYKKTPANQQEEIKIYPLVQFRTDWYSDSDPAGSSAPFGLRGNDFNPDPFSLSQTTISDGFQIKINGRIYKTPMYLTYGSFLTFVSASGFLLIEGVDERLTE